MQSHSEVGTALEATDPSAGYASIDAVQQEMASARAQNNYDLIRTDKPQGQYQALQLSNEGHYEVDLDKLNRAQDQYLDGKLAKLHANYDDLPD